MPPDPEPAPDASSDDEPIDLSEAIVIIETDPEGDGYDAQLVGWLHRVQRAPMLPFPSTHGLSPEQIERGYAFVSAVITLGAGQPSWPLRLRLRVGVRPLPAAAVGRCCWDLLPDDRDEARLALHVQAVPEQAALPDWLDAWLSQRGCEKLSSRPMRSGADVDGDVLVRWRDAADGGDRYGRVVTRRLGDVVFVLELIAARDRFADVVHDVLVAHGSLAVE
ncbi:MAG: hypothetical protein ACE37K_04085 [Planctomycetota bacterium]